MRFNKRLFTKIITEDLEISINDGINAISVVSLSDTGVYIEGKASFKGMTSEPVPLLKGEAFNYSFDGDVSGFWIRISGGSAKITLNH